MSNPPQEDNSVDILDIHAHRQYLGSHDDLSLMEGILHTVILKPSDDLYLLFLLDERVVHMTVIEIVLQEPVDPIGIIDRTTEHQHSLRFHIPLTSLHDLQQRRHFIRIPRNRDYLVRPKQLAYKVTMYVQCLGELDSNEAISSGGEQDGGEGPQGVLTTNLLDGLG